MKISSLFEICVDNIDEQKLFSSPFPKFRKFLYGVRLAIVIYLTIFMAYFVLSYGSFNERFFTQQTYIFAYLYFFFSTFFSTFPKDLHIKKQSSYSSPFHSGALRLVYVLFIVSIANTLFAMGGFWGGVVFEPPRKEYTPAYLAFFGVNCHGVTYVLLLIDLLFINTFTMSFKHIIYIYCVNIPYLVWAVLYFVRNREWIYNYIRLDSPKAPLLYVILLALVLVTYSIPYCLCRLRNYIQKRFFFGYFNIKADALLENITVGGSGSGSGSGSDTNSVRANRMAEEGSDEGFKNTGYKKVGLLEADYISAESSGVGSNGDNGVRSGGSNSGRSGRSGSDPGGIDDGGGRWNASTLMGMNS